MPITYRPIALDEFERFDLAEARGFSAHPDSNSEIKDFERRVFEPERSVVAFDGDLMVGTCGSFTFEMSVPGGAKLRLGGTSHVTVSPTHRRRGILTEMMRRQLDGYRERGEPLAALWTSETVIYGRFGYGLALMHERREIDRRHTAFAHSPDIGGQVKFVDKKEAAKVFAPIYERACEMFPGMIGRNDLWWEAALADPSAMRNQAPALFHAFYEVDGIPTGYVMYRVRHNWNDSLPDSIQGSRVGIHELVASDDEATAALWRFCFDIDLVNTITAGGGVPIDDGLTWMLADPRRLTRKPYDGLWLRLVDVPTALSARTYAEEGSLAIEVEDSFCKWNDGTWRVDGGTEGADCAATNDEPDITLSAGDLAAIYLGGAKPSELARAGRVVERTAGSLGRADRMFATARSPWNLVDF
ncbi:MAG: GNAT family N-acetyltransferase [Chloroflexi bacterium]|nr:GNAT family N-acetyltransferase [Chloroflexota bacterium]